MERTWIFVAIAVVDYFFVMLLLVCLVAFVVEVVDCVVTSVSLMTFCCWYYLVIVIVGAAAVCVVYPVLIAYRLTHTSTVPPYPPSTPCPSTPPLPPALNTVQVTRLVVRQSVKVPITEKSTVTCGGYSLHHRGMGAGSMYVSAHHELSQAEWVGSLVQLGHQPKIGFSCGSSNNNSGRSVQVGGGVFQAGDAMK